MMIRKIRESATRTNVQCLLGLIDDGQEFTSTQFVRAGLMSAQEVSAALKYAVRHELLVKTKYGGTSTRERYRYRLSGKLLSDEVSSSAPLSFDSLLGAWGIGHVCISTGGASAPALGCRVLIND